MNVEELLIVVVALAIGEYLFCYPVVELLIVVVALAIGEYLFCYPVVATMYIAYYTLLYS